MDNFRIPAGQYCVVVNRFLGFFSIVACIAAGGVCKQTAAGIIFLDCSDLNG